MLFPAIISLMTEVEDDIEIWAESNEEKIVG
jgi:hypothetical protein